MVALITLLGLCYYTLQSSWVQTQITKKIADRLSKQLNTTISVGKVDIGFFNRLYLEDVLIEDRNSDTLLYSQLITAKIDTLKIGKQRLAIEELILQNNKLNIEHDSANTYNFSFILNSFNKPNNRDSLKRWKISCDHFDFGQIDITYNDVHEEKPKLFVVHNLNMEVSQFYSVPDSLSFHLNQLSLNDGNNLVVQNASALVHFKKGKVDINELNLKSSHSVIEDSDLQLQFFVKSDSMKTPFDINMRIGKSTISLREIGELVPALKGMDQEIDLSGLIYGNQNDLKGKNLYLNTGMETQAILDFYINDIVNPDNMYLFLDLKSSETSFSDLSNIHFPNNSRFKYLQFPESFYTAGLLKFRGNFSGFLSDFVTFGTLESHMGSLTTDIMVMPEKEGTVYYRGNISTTDFKLGQLFQNQDLGNLTFSGSTDGKYNKKTEAISGIFKGNIAKIDLFDYNYKNIRFDGILVNKMFDGLLSINDPNLQFSFLGKLDLNKDLPHFDFNVNVKKALPNKLKLGTNFPDAEIAFKMNANVEGSQIDNLDGAIFIKEGYYKNRNGKLDLGGIELKSIPQIEKNTILLNSDFLDASVTGEYNFGSITSSIQKIIQNYISAYPFKMEENAVPNNFDYQISVKDVNNLLKVFIPKLEFETPFLLYGKIDSPNNDFQLTGSIPGIKYKNIWARNIFIGNKGANNLYSSKFRIGELFNKNGLRLHNFSIESTIEDNLLNNVISWSNYDELTYSGSLRTQTRFLDTDLKKHIEIKGLPSQIYIADTLWTINSYLAHIDSNSLEIKNFNISHEDQLIEASGKITEGKTDQLNIKLKDINLGYLNEYLDADFMLEGIINGNFSISKDLFSPVILSDIKIDDLRYKNQFLGNISLSSRWNNSRSTIDSELDIIRNNRKNLNAFGYYKPSTQELNFNTKIDSLSLMVLDVFLQKNFSNVKGYGTGRARINGTLDKININGAVLVEDAGLTVNVTQIPYSFTDSIYFKNDTIHFDNLTVYDDRDNPALFDGTIVHTNFNNMYFDLHFSSEKLRALNTTSIDNEQFYGVAIANGRFDITGPITATKLTGSATTLSGTDLSISMESERDIETYDFIEFVKPSTSEEYSFFEEEVVKQRGNYDLSLTIEATPEAKIQVIYNSQIGDVIKARGEGILLFEMDQEANMKLSGNYNPTQGDYLFTLQNVLNKRFTIEPGGSIIWSGDPYNAIIDLKAIYKLKASLYELLFDEPAYANKNQRVQVECIIELEDELANPTIGFDINFPNADERTKDVTRQYFSTDEDMNKQILSLIVTGKFYTPEYKRGTYEAQNTNMIGTTASEVFSNQLSNWVSQISSKWDVGFNYRPGNQVTDDEIEVALSTQIFNDRVSLNGNIGNNTNEYTNNSSQIVGDFEMSVKLVPSGKIQFKAYNRSNNNLIYETAPYTQGIGLSFKEEYNSIDELLQKLTKIFRKKKSNK
uniref:translocation/assembly module TamB domain-containing protein n=1 Tax=uncultured Draconibacterium sp. TaxID=1573823 RepID=UPI0032178C8B